MMVSPICFGSLRLSPAESVYRETFHKALEHGIHFIDTSGTYGNGASEIVIGDVLAEYLTLNPEQKDSIVLCTKIGFVHGTVSQEILRQKRKVENFLFKISEKFFYCLTPEFIESQITLSLRRLQQDRVNLLLIQNPEVLFRFMSREKVFEEHLKRAFEHLEVEVSRGRIQHYGISSHAFLNKDISKNFLSLGKIFNIARNISKNHHFSVVQTPFNLFESSALFIPNQEKFSFFEMAKKLDLGVLSCRPLISRHRHKVYHFITFPGKDEVSIKGHLHKTLMDVVELEKSFLKKRPDDKSFCWGHWLKGNLNEISDWWQWKTYLKKEILPTIEERIDRLPQDDEWNHWKIHYVNNIHNLFTLITDSLKAISNLRTNQICRYLDEQYPPLKSDSKLSNKVMRLYLSLPEIDSVIMGLSHPRHIEDLLRLGPPIKESQTRSILKKLKMHF